MTGTLYGQESIGETVQADNRWDGFATSCPNVPIMTEPQNNYL